MPRYFFHLHECGDIDSDYEGVQCADLEAARDHAIMCARDLMAKEVRAGRLCLRCMIKVHDAANQLVLTVAFREALVLYD